jgi:hypothetical protein
VGFWRRGPPRGYLLRKVFGGLGIGLDLWCECGLAVMVSVFLGLSWRGRCQAGLPGRGEHTPGAEAPLLLGGGEAQG